MMIANKLYYPFYGDVENDEEKLNARVSEVMRELGERGKAKTKPAAPAVAKTPQKPPQKPKASKKSSAVAVSAVPLHCCSTERIK